jgi:pyoverdine/dityrosine biosynthesis protein Dit1
MMEPVIARDEPFGHLEYLSKIERAWLDLPQGSSLLRRRTERFDAVNSVLYAPVEYQYPFIRNDLPTTPPDLDWITRNFLAFVRGEFSDVARPHPPTYQPTAITESFVSLSALQQCLETCESEFVYGGLVDRVVKERSEDMVGAIYDLLCNPALGHKQNGTNMPLDTLRKKIETQVEHRNRLALLLPAFPFKDQNRFRTTSGPSTVDIGEISLLIRLHCLALALYQVHPFGADIVILSDGLLYADIFGVQPEQAKRYREQVRGFRNLLNLQGTVSILDLSELIDRFRLDPICGSRVTGIISEIETHVMSFEQMANELGDAFKVLMRGMKWNLSTRESLGHLCDTDAWTVVTEMRRDLVPDHLLREWLDIEERARNAAVRYAGVNLMLRYCDLLNRVFPGSLRGTVHPKPDQLAIPLEGKLYPWNGVALVGNDGPFGTDIKTVPFYELAGLSVELVRLDMTGDPLYYCVNS